MLVHELWEEVDGGVVTHTCCIAGPPGDSGRRLLTPGARLLTTFEAGSHHEAMTAFNRHLDFGPYTASDPCVFEPYPAEWQAEQRAAEGDGA